MFFILFYFEKHTYLDINSVAPPFFFHFRRSSERLARIAHVFLQKPKLTSDEAGVMSVSCPAGGIDGVEGGVNVCPSLDELWEDEWWWI